MDSSKEPQRVSAIEIIDKYESAKGTKIMNELRLLQICHYIVINNYRDLIRMISVAEKDFTIMNRDKFEKFFLVIREITRRLHNYLASIQSLIDHTRRFRKVIDNPKLESLFNKEIQKFTRNNCTSFVKLFRNYIQHYTLPIVAARLHVERKEPDKPNFKEDLSILLEKDELLKWGGWNKPSKDYIHKFGKEIPLKKVFEEYMILNNHFYEWFYDKIVELHEDDIEEFFKLSKKLDELFK